MDKLNETQRIDILIKVGCDDRLRTQNEVCHLLNAKYDDSQTSVYRKENLKEI